MGSFQVFVEGPVDPSPGGLEKLAAAMEARYGLAAAELIARMQKGRFRVKANIDRATADAYMKDLTKIGARARVEEMGANAVTSVLPSAPRATTPPQLSSGLAAAFSGNIPVANLGALESTELSLASLDGSDAAVVPPASELMPASIGPPPSDLMPASIGPPPARPPVRESHTSSPPPPKPAVSDRFLPPEVQTEEAVLELAAPVAPSTPVLRPRPSIPPANITFEPGATAVAAPPRWKFAAGVLIAIVLGFVPAHFVGAMRESSAYAAIDKNLVAAQAAAVTPEDFDGLDALRARALDDKRSARRMIMLQALLVWAVAGGAIGFGWSLLNRPRAKAA